MARRLRKSYCSSFPTSAMKGSNRRINPDSIEPEPPISYGSMRTSPRLLHTPISQNVWTTSPRHILIPSILSQSRHRSVHRPRSFRVPPHTPAFFFERTRKFFRYGLFFSLIADEYVAHRRGSAFLRLRVVKGRAVLAVRARLYASVVYIHRQEAKDQRQLKQIGGQGVSHKPSRMPADNDISGTVH
jgi:hypothetical protein